MLKAGVVKFGMVVVVVLLSPTLAFPFSIVGVNPPSVETGSEGITVTLSLAPGVLLVWGVRGWAGLRSCLVLVRGR